MEIWISVIPARTVGFSSSSTVQGRKEWNGPFHPACNFGSKQTDGLLAKATADALVQSVTTYSQSTTRFLLVVVWIAARRGSLPPYRCSLSPLSRCDLLW